jgi:hypothetical protein
MRQMYRKVRQPTAEKLTRRDRIGLITAGAVLAAGFAGAGIYAAVQPGGYGQSRDGCVTVSEPSSTGGALIHQCGGGAIRMCRGAYAHTDRLSMLTRPQCRLAGLGPGQVSGSSPDGAGGR